MRNRRSRIVRLALALLLTLAFAVPAPGQDPGVVVEPSSPAERIRDYLVSLEFEKALVAIETALADPALDDDGRAELWVLRAQAHVAFGDLDAAEDDYAQILGLRPGFEPDPSLTPKKAMDRFAAVRERTIGWIALDVTPADADIRVDGASRAPGADGRLPLVAGSHALEIAREGYDAHRQPVAVEAGQTATIEVTLVPNARTLVVRTDQEGVEVLLDGRPVGRTARTAEGFGDGVSELSLPSVPLGEHQIELRKDCFRPAMISEVLSVDLMDPGPRRLRVESLEPVQATLELRGAIDGSTLTIDDAFVGRFPLGPVSTCPGERTIEIALADRTLWSSRETLPEGTPTAIDVRPRPNLVLAGAERLPPDLAGAGERFNLRAVVPLPDGDPARPETWDSVDLPRDTALVLAVVPGRRAGAADRRWLYSPGLEAVADPIDVGDWRRPTWTRALFGVRVADAIDLGRPTVVALTPDGPAARAGLVVGDVLTGVGGNAVGSSSAVREALARAGDSPPVVRWKRRDGSTGEARLTPATSPALRADAAVGANALVRAAWAEVDGLAPGIDGASALANLALLLEAAGRLERALDVWQQVRWPEGRAGIGAGTTQYHVGRLHARRGDDAAAERAFRAAASSAATFLDDGGPPVAPAARDHLADLGVSLR